MPPQITSEEYVENNELLESVDQHELEKPDPAKAVKEYVEGLHTKFEPMLESARVIGQRSDRIPELSELPELSGLMSQLGLDEEQTQAIFTSWTSFNGLKRAVSNADRKKLPNVPREVIEQGLQTESEMMQKEIEAITDFTEKYSSAELQAVISIFGIHHFSRYSAEMLHEQLEAWMGNSLPKNVVVSARSDWNGAMSDEGEAHGFQYVDEQTFYFEAGSGKEIGEVALQVGNRERQLGRIPEETNPVKNFLIHAHANPNAMLLSDTENGRLFVEDYEDSAQKRSKIGAKVNNYQKHLGKGARIILRGCSTAGDNGDKPNIATTISDEHDVFVEAAEFPTRSVVINGDTVKFYVSKNRKFWRDTEGFEDGIELDGRGGDGVLKG